MEDQNFIYSIAMTTALVTPFAILHRRKKSKRKRKAWIDLFLQDKQDSEYFRVMETLRNYGHDRHIPLEAKFSTFFGPKMPFSENVLGTIRKIYREN